MNPIRRRLAYVLFLGAAGSFARPARAELTKHECVEANANGQHLLVGGKLTAASAAFQSCATAACPAVVQNDCVKRLDEVDRVRPAIIFEAKDASGNDISSVAVTMDGAPFASRLDGTPLFVDPGEHVFTFETAGSVPVTKTFVLAERDQSRRERVVMGLPIATPAQTTSTASPLQTNEPVTPSEAGHSGITMVQKLGLLTGCVGIVGIGVATAFGLMSGSALDSQQSACASPTNCPNHPQALADHSSYTTDRGVETAGFVAGGVLVAAGVAMFVVGNKTETRKTGLVALPAVSPGTAGVVLRGAF